MGHIHPQSSNDDATLPADVEGDGEPESWPKTSVLKSGTTMTVLLSLITSVTATIHNICAILLGHVALRWIPVYPASSHAFVDADFVTTLRLAIIGSSVLVIPLLLATILSPEGRTSCGIGSSETRQTEATPVSRCLSRPVPPRVHALLWQAWMVSAAPMGSLLCDAIFLELDPGSCLGARNAALASFVGRLALLAAERVSRPSAQPDTEAEVETGYFSAEKSWRGDTPTR